MFVNKGAGWNFILWEKGIDKFNQQYWKLCVNVRFTTTGVYHAHMRHASDAEYEKSGLRVSAFLRYTKRSATDNLVIVFSIVYYNFINVSANVILPSALRPWESVSL
jgi:hypothetical protein